MNIYSADKTKNTVVKEEQVVKEQSSWSKLIKGIIRPPRSNYKEISLGSKNFILNEVRYQRNDLQINHQQKILTLTIYEPEYKNHWLILYLHGNSSSRLESTSIIKYMPYKFTLAAFDFIGCGRNHEGDTISLGIRQSQQVDTVMKFLSKAGYRVLLWGRSMGAATALKHGRAPVIVADSSFQSFKSLCKQIAIKNSPKMIPNCLISCLFPCVFSKLRSDIQDQANYDIEQLNIMKDVQRIHPDTMIVFMSGDQDNLIDSANSLKLYNSYQGKNKYLQIFKGTHNTKRPEEILKKIMRLIEIYIEQYDRNKKQNASKTKLQLDLNQQVVTEQ